MSSSYQQKKMKTLATRKKTRKRRMEDGMTFEEDADRRRFQPPSTRNSHWEPNSSKNAVMSSISKTKRQKKADKKRRKLATDQGHGGDDNIESLQPVSAPSDEIAKLNDFNVDGESGALLTLAKPPLQLCKSLDDMVEKAAAIHAAIRRNDGRQKTKVLLLVDARSLFKLMKKKMCIRPVMVKPKSRRGVGSAKKPELIYRNTGLVKTPLDRFKDVNKTVLTSYKSGKLSSLLAEDLSFYPYTDFNVQHVILIAKEAASAMILNRHVLQNVKLHSFVMDDKSARGLSEDEIKALTQVYTITSP